MIFERCSSVEWRQYGTDGGAVYKYGIGTTIYYSHAHGMLGRFVGSIAVCAVPDVLFYIARALCA